MKLYLQLTRLFLRAGFGFGFVMAFFIAINGNMMMGLAYGFITGALLAYGVPLILMIAGRKELARHVD